MIGVCFKLSVVHHQSADSLFWTRRKHQKNIFALNVSWPTPRHNKLIHDVVGRNSEFAKSNIS
jgi:hypothetical protein